MALFLAYNEHKINDFEIIGFMWCNIFEIVGFKVFIITKHACSNFSLCSAAFNLSVIFVRHSFSRNKTRGFHQHIKLIIAQNVSQIKFQLYN